MFELYRYRCPYVIGGTNDVIDRITIANTHEARMHIDTNLSFYVNRQSVTKIDGHI